MFEKYKSTADTSFQKQYCNGFNVGISLVKKIPPKHWELTKDVLHAMISENSKNISFHSILTGFTCEIVNERNKERLAEIQKINEKSQDKEKERSR